MTLNVNLNPTLTPFNQVKIFRDVNKEQRVNRSTLENVTKPTSELKISTYQDKSIDGKVKAYKVSLQKMIDDGTVHFNNEDEYKSQIQRYQNGLIEEETKTANLLKGKTDAKIYAQLKAKEINNAKDIVAHNLKIDNKVENYKKSLQKMVDNKQIKFENHAQFNAQVQRYREGLIEQEIKTANLLKGKEIARKIAQDNAELDKQITYEQEYHKASMHPTQTTLGRQKYNTGRHGRTSAQQIIKEAENSQLKGQMRKQMHIDAMKIRVESGNASPLKKAKMKHVLNKDQTILNREIEKTSEAAKKYSDKINTKKRQKRVKLNSKPNVPDVVTNIPETIKDSVEPAVKKMSKTKIGLIVATILTITGGLLYANKKHSEKNEVKQFNIAA